MKSLDIQRFQSKVAYQPSGCWDWLGGRFDSGYGLFKVERKMRRAHRVAWELDNGRQVPQGMCVCHVCDNRKCVKPTHLFLATNDENMADMKAKGRAARGERSGMAKLRADDVRCIRLRIDMGDHFSDIAREYGVSHQLISAINTGHCWGHLT